MSKPADHEARMQRVRRSLDGLSVGDAFGERFFVPPDIVGRRLLARDVDHPPPWRWTDDTAMALSIVEALEETGQIRPDDLSERLLHRYRAEPWRGYGGGAHQLFEELWAGSNWQAAAGSLFRGTGSYGNGSAMRVAPVGAYFAGNDEAVVAAARRSAVVTHAHPEGQAGAIAVAVAASVAWMTRELSPEDAAAKIFDSVLKHAPAGKTHNGIAEASKLSLETGIDVASRRLGNGSGVSSQDTVPLCIWCIARHLRDYEEAMWTTVAALGDRDTTCAIVGGVVALAAPDPAIPQAWLDAREPLEGISLEELPVGN